MTSSPRRVTKRCKFSRVPNVASWWFAVSRAFLGSVIVPFASRSVTNAKFAWSIVQHIQMIQKLIAPPIGARTVPILAILLRGLRAAKRLLPLRLLFLERLVLAVLFTKQDGCTGQLGAQAARTPRR